MVKKKGIFKDPTISFWMKQETNRNTINYKSFKLSQNNKNCRAGLVHRLKCSLFVENICLRWFWMHVVSFSFFDVLNLLTNDEWLIEILAIKIFLIIKFFKGLNARLSANFRISRKLAYWLRNSCQNIVSHSQMCHFGQHYSVPKYFLELGTVLKINC